MTPIVVERAGARCTAIAGPGGALRKAVFDPRDAAGPCAEGNLKDSAPAGLWRWE